MKAYSAIAIANEFLDLAEKEGDNVDPLKLQKIVYICHGRYLGFYGYPLIKERVEAWEWGPVIPEIYHQFKKFGRNPISEKGVIVDESSIFDALDEISDKIDFIQPEIDSEREREFVKRIWNKYKKYTGIQLSNSTHQDGTPWAKAKSKNQNIITDEEIKGYYEGLLANG